jgi:hypothetical protein
MSDIQWALMKPNEDGHSLRTLTDGELRELLADPQAWGVCEFIDVDALGTDPNYWTDGSGMLLRVEVVVPVRGGYRLPDDVAHEPFETTPAQAAEWVRLDDGPIRLGDVIE